MPFQEFTCTGCNLSTISSFDLTDRPHLDCPGGVGSWLSSEQSGQTDDGHSLAESELSNDEMDDAFEII